MKHGKCLGGRSLMDVKDRLILALDVPSVAAAAAMVEKLGSSVTFYKIGYQLAFAGGLSFADTLISRQQEGVPRSQAARHRQHGRQGRRKHRQARRNVPHRARLSADHACRGRRAQRLELRILASPC
jgi:hypothetical protein